jgi:hypothetical protein
MPGPVFIYFALIGLATLALAASFAFRPTERTLGILRPLCAATIYSALAAFFAGVTNGLYALSRLLDASSAAAPGRLWPTVVGAFAESPIPLVVGFAGVSVAWLLVAVGLRRQAG